MVRNVKIQVDFLFNAFYSMNSQFLKQTFIIRAVKIDKIIPEADKIDYQVDRQNTFAATEEQRAIKLYKPLEEYIQVQNLCQKQNSLKQCLTSVKNVTYKKQRYINAQETMQTMIAKLSLYFKFKILTIDDKEQIQKIDSSLQLSALFPVQSPNKQTIIQVKEIKIMNLQMAIGIYILGLSSIMERMVSYKQSRKKQMSIFNLNYLQSNLDDNKNLDKKNAKVSSLKNYMSYKQTSDSETDNNQLIN
ncbi:hypothetical protein TTHERM_00414470 (macronuclear) [Tetrahymena thermophila SB210]|uniref:Uncharacterized protein n=1 Tax=Tetrahymena thermophila (strain SB210) TaxID=312017 RepID=Q22P44_TETTS|nr:hypothetical protein TTHERM_00414470 [Tetrahymena thermophila SB210]EAR86967.1 hypothetical protein TTHERM_00414470 [Tetrahymena thermophila SB210]|eukprot:XP_001007212.1 hypothetical protein TTHERM_00414470 [Tetrahymena thermophila SB210]